MAVWLWLSVPLIWWKKSLLTSPKKRSGEEPTSRKTQTSSVKTPWTSPGKTPSTPVVLGPEVCHCANRLGTSLLVPPVFHGNLPCIETRNAASWPKQPRLEVTNVPAVQVNLRHKKAIQCHHYHVLISYIWLYLRGNTRIRSISSFYVDSFGVLVRSVWMILKWAPSKLCHQKMCAFFPASWAPYIAIVLTFQCITNYEPSRLGRFCGGRSDHIHNVLHNIYIYSKKATKLVSWVFFWD